ncbi:hypothetical protein [Mucilaginibacter ginkgonis]|uniref:Uncharacterized protein n=1 Tax=Mucilaginibacter ginkgonis TaxID=2682091 RepID=A0A6I4HUB0_9SPHI|nr:hypothetical protein [Mucilaginibacter ginkgonis]QQL50327.1 hypothetical protein GO620_002410 [Mucilaginibacter ginkgonis]
MKKIIVAVLALIVSAAAFCKSKTLQRDSSTNALVFKPDTILHLAPKKAGQLFAVLNLSAEAIAHTTSKNINVEQANQALQLIADIQKYIKEWADKINTQRSSLPTTQ